jgi:hypothetical protein
MVTWTWNHRDGDRKTWRHRHETWIHGEMETWTWRHGYGNVDMKTDMELKIGEF